MVFPDFLGEKFRDSVYIIAEIGQNHQGNLETAKAMIIEAKKVGCHCVKFQKSDLTAKFTTSALCRKYLSEHSWGNTYGDHKRYLEFTNSQYIELQTFCKAIEIDFTASAMDENSLAFLATLKVPFIKIGSGDANNFPLLQKAACLDIPLVISIGMQTMSTVDHIVKIMNQAGHRKYALLHCVSSYPTLPRDCNLQLIPTLIKRFPSILIGYSGHELGIVISQAAVLAGARILERHFTLDKNQKGSDHLCSLEPQEFKALVCGIERLKNNQTFKIGSYSYFEIIKILNCGDELEEVFHNSLDKEVLDCEKSCRRKLGKTIVAAKNILKGRPLEVKDLAIKVSEPCGLPAEKYFDIIGKTLKNNLNKDDPIIAEIITPFTVD